MSEADQHRWDARYRADSFVGHKPANAFLREVADQLPDGRALDVACGAGRNAVFLAERGFAVDALDISSEGLARGAELAGRCGVRVNWQQVDLLDAPLLPRRDYQVILMLRFVAPALLELLPDHLAPGGVVIVEQHMQWPEPVDGPGSDRFRVEPGSLAEALASLRTIHYFEGLIDEAGGGHAAVARIMAAKS